MELVTFAKEVLQNIAEQAASYRLGQAALRYLDRALWVVEKCAKWSVPPPLDQDERPQPELIRPLPWVFFLLLLVVLRVTRESISLINLVLGKPPLRSADVVSYIQSKRRYLRTLKYQGNRVMRARSSAAQRESWYGAVQSLLELSMCFRRQAPYGNNNTTRLSNNDEILVVKCGKRDPEDAEPVASTSETTMERLIEKMMTDLDAESDDDSSYTLTNIPSLRSESENTESDQDTVQTNDAETPVQSITTPSTPEREKLRPPGLSIPEIRIIEATPIKEDRESRTPEKTTTESASQVKNEATDQKEEPSDIVDSQKITSTPDKSHVALNSTEEKEIDQWTREDATLSQSSEEHKSSSAVEESQKFIQGEKCTTKSQQTPKKEQKIVNGRTKKSAPNKKRGGRERRDSDVPVVRITPADDAVSVRTDNIRQPH